MTLLVPAIIEKNRSPVPGPVNLVPYVICIYVYIRSLENTAARFCPVAEFSLDGALTDWCMDLTVI